MKMPSFSISDVSSTMLITLYARAYESVSQDPIIVDPKAVEMIEVIKKVISGSDNPIHKKIIKNNYNPKLAVTMALRRRPVLYLTKYQIFLKSWLFEDNYLAFSPRLSTRKVHCKSVNYSGLFVSSRNNSRKILINCIFYKNFLVFSPVSFLRMNIDENNSTSTILRFFVTLY